jgi:hypothetical protein
MDIDEEKKETPFTLRDGGCQYFDQKQRFPSLVVRILFSRVQKRYNRRQQQ